LLAAAPAGGQQVPQFPSGGPNVNAGNIQNVVQFVEGELTGVITGSTQTTILSWGRQFLTAIALILIVWTGLRVAFSGTFQAWELIRFIIVLSLPYGMLEFYRTPFPMTGGPNLTFPQIVTGLGSALTGLFGADIIAEGIQAVMALAHDHMQIVGSEADSFSIWRAIRTGGKQVTHLALMTALLGSFVLGMTFVVALAIAQVIFAQIAIAVLVTLGPIFIPFMVVPKMDFLFWGWLKALIQYSLYSAIAAVMVTVWTNIILGLARGLSQQNFTLQSITVGAGLWFVPAFVLIFCAIVCILKIGDIAGMIVGGGSDGGGFIGGAFMAGRVVAAPARVAAAPLKGGVPA